MSVNKTYASLLREEAAELIERAEKLESGAELCDHHWNGSDNCYECYCSGCNKHHTSIYGYNNLGEIPTIQEALCFQCRKTPEQKELEKQQAAESLRQSELKKLAELKEKYEANHDQP